MTTTVVKAIYEGGVLRPMTPIDLAEGQEANIIIQSAEKTVLLDPQWVETFLSEIEAVYEPTGQVETTSVDHDKILYGEHGAA
jgi:predicted DNA-binding antitoxin AbrB/MazE fold protein